MASSGLCFKGTASCCVGGSGIGGKRGSKKSSEKANEFVQLSDDGGFDLTDIVWVLRRHQPWKKRSTGLAVWQGQESGTSHRFGV